MFIRTCEKVINGSDLQNLVIAILLRQEHPFKRNYCLKVINRYLRRSDYFWSNETAENLDENLNFLQRNDRLRCVDGVFYPKNVMTGDFDFSDTNIQI